MVKDLFILNEIPFGYNKLHFVHQIALQDTNVRKSAPESEKMLAGEQCHNNAVFDLEWMPNEMKFVSASGKILGAILIGVRNISNKLT